MSEFKVRIQNLNSAMDSTQQLENMLKQAAEGVQSVKRNLRVQIRQRERIDSRLVTSAQKLESQRQTLGRVVQTGRQAAELYQKNEQELLGLKRDGNSKTEKTPFDIKDLFNWSNLWKLIGSGGIVGQTAKMISSLWSGDLLGAGKELAKIVGSGAKLAEKDGPVTWLDLIGRTTRSNVPQTYKEALGTELGKYKIGDGQSAGKNVQAAAKWAGNILTVAETGISNWKEYENQGGWSNPEMYAETAVESALKIGSGIAISAAVSLFTPVGWTALGVGAAVVVTTAVVNWIGDGVSCLITGNQDGWVENVSDGIIKGTKYLAGKAEEAKNAIVSWAKDLFK